MCLTLSITLEDKPDFIVLDPPRDGIHPKALEKIIDYGVESMVYISCKPTSLARDLDMFAGQQGMRLRRAAAWICFRIRVMSRRLSCFPRAKSTRKRFGLSSLWKIWICPNFRMGQPTPSSRTMCWNIAG